MERIRVITHQSQRVLLVDCSDCKADEIAELVRKFMEAKK